ncbi:MAG: lipase [Polyangiaceae bacterium]|nr:lipase [Polyangiaceae bacterium]
MKSTHRLGLFTAALFLATAASGCIAAADPDGTEGDDGIGEDQVDEREEAASTAGFTPHFQQWLTANGYDQYNLVRSDLVGGSYGGKASGADTVVNQPVIFVHGNSDKAVGSSPGQTGWNASIDYFISKGYKTSELYATTWGPADMSLSPYQYHSKTYVMKIRKLIEAVKAYTGASKVDVIAHSMGVTLARKAIKGGSASDALEGGSYSVGPAITSWIDTFVGIAGANRGLTSCYLSGPTTYTCGSTNGLYPGVLGMFGVYGRSAYLDDLLATSGYEGSYRYTIHSTVDEVIGYGGLVYGEYTARIPGQTGEVMFTSVPYGHFNSKDLTGYNQWRMVKYHATN